METGRAHHGAVVTGGQRSQRARDRVHRHHVHGHGQRAHARDGFRLQDGPEEALQPALAVEMACGAVARRDIQDEFVVALTLAKLIREAR